MNVRRLPGFMYHYKVVTLLLFTTMLLVVYLLLHWGIMCTNLQAWRHVSNVVSRPFRNNSFTHSPRFEREREITITVLHRSRHTRTAYRERIRRRQVALGSHTGVTLAMGWKAKEGRERKGQGTNRRARTRPHDVHETDWFCATLPCQFHVYAYESSSRGRRKKSSTRPYLGACIYICCDFSGPRPLRNACYPCKPSKFQEFCHHRVELITFSSRQINRLFQFFWITFLNSVCLLERNKILSWIACSLKIPRFIDEFCWSVERSFFFPLFCRVSEIFVKNYRNCLANIGWNFLIAVFLLTDVENNSSFD